MHGISRAVAAPRQQELRMSLKFVYIEPRQMAGSVKIFYTVRIVLQRIANQVVR